MTRVRLYRDEDFGQVVDIAVNEIELLPEQDLSEAEGVIRWASSDDAAQIFVAETDGKVVGFLMLQWNGTGWNRVAEIGWIAVLPDYQRKGIGGNLIKEMVKYARKNNIRKVYVEPSVRSNSAIRFYVKNGFNHEATRKDWYRDGEDSAILGMHLQKTRPATELKQTLELTLRRFREDDVEGIRRIYEQFFEDCPHFRNEEGFVVAIDRFTDLE